MAQWDITEKCNYEEDINVIIVSGCCNIFSM